MKIWLAFQLQKLLNQLCIQLKGIHRSRMRINPGAWFWSEPLIRAVFILGIESGKPASQSRRRAWKMKWDTARGRFHDVYWIVALNRKRQITRSTKHLTNDAASACVLTGKVLCAERDMMWYSFRRRRETSREMWKKFQSRDQCVRSLSQKHFKWIMYATHYGLLHFHFVRQYLCALFKQLSWRENMRTPGFYCDSWYTSAILFRPAADSERVREWMEWAHKIHARCKELFFHGQAR